MIQTNCIESELANFPLVKEEYDRTEAKFRKIREADEEIMKDITIPIKKENLEDGEYLCSSCNGKKAYFNSSGQLIHRCPLCNGKGKTDWIENIYGKVNSYEW